MRRLVAYDGSPSARRALAHASGLHRSGDAIGLIHVVEQLSSGDGQLDEARAALAARGIEAASMEVVGNPAHEICITAERREYDTIVVGRRNVLDTGLVLLGSVSGRVVAGAPCNVVVVA
jgi:nucleotide-binding universal stress UspA family protein